MDPPFDYDDFYFIDDPPKFLQVLRVALTAEIETSKDFQLFESELSQIMNWHVIAEWGPIHYKKEVWELINRSPENLSNILLAYFTKPEHYHKENEYRFLLAYVAEVKMDYNF